MSRLGKLPIALPAGVSAEIKGGHLHVKGPKAELKERLHSFVSVVVSEGAVQVSATDSEDRKHRAFWGLYWSLIRNMVIGVSAGFEKKLDLVGVGYRVAIAGQKLTLNVGYSHPVEYVLPDVVSGKVEGNSIILNSASKQILGETAAQIRRVRPPEPYKGKGIKYSDEILRRKEGKTSSK